MPPLVYSQFPLTFLKQLQSFRDQQFLCDVRLVAEEIDFHAHKLVLAASSSYFKDLFQSKKGGQNDPPEVMPIYLKNCNADCVTVVLQFLYSGELHLRQCNPKDVLNVARACKITALESMLDSYPNQNSTITDPTNQESQHGQNGKLFNQSALQASSTNQSKNNNTNNNNNNNFHKAIHYNASGNGPNVNKSKNNQTRKHRASSSPTSNLENRKKSSSMANMNMNMNTVTANINNSTTNNKSYCNKNNNNDFNNKNTTTVNNVSSLAINTTIPTTGNYNTSSNGNNSNINNHHHHNSLPSQNDAQQHSTVKRPKHSQKDHMKEKANGKICQVHGTYNCNCGADGQPPDSASFLQFFLSNPAFFNPGAMIGGGENTVLNPYSGLLSPKSPPDFAQFSPQSPFEQLCRLQAPGPQQNHQSPQQLSPHPLVAQTPSQQSPNDKKLAKDFIKKCKLEPIICEDLPDSGQSSPKKVTGSDPIPTEDDVDKLLADDRDGWCRNKKFIKKIPTGGFQCTLCKKVYGRYNSVSYHVTIYHRNKPIKCTEPGCTFTTREARYIHFHKFYRHDIPLPPNIDLEARRCPDCKHVAKSPAMLEKHMKRHQPGGCVRLGKPFVCQYCGKEFASKSNMIQHLETHKQEIVVPNGIIKEEEDSIFACDQCSYKCRTATSLKQHQLFKHSGDLWRNKFQCDECNYSTPSQSKLVQHKAQIHNPSLLAIAGSFCALSDEPENLEPQMSTGRGKKASTGSKVKKSPSGSTLIISEEDYEEDEEVEEGGVVGSVFGEENSENELVSGLQIEKFLHESHCVTSSV